MFHRTHLLLLHAREQQHRAMHRAPGSARWEGGRGVWGFGEEGGEEGVAHKQQWMVHPLCWCQTSPALLPTQLRRAAHDATAAGEWLRWSAIVFSIAKFHFKYDAIFRIG